MGPRRRSTSLRSRGPAGQGEARDAGPAGPDRPAGRAGSSSWNVWSSLTSSVARLSTSRIIAWGCAVRLFLIVFGAFQDAHAEVPYTDIDYQVYSDAARFICEGESPYARSTYRYTPLLAWLLTPNCIFPSYGKVLFAVCDIMAAMLMIRERELLDEGEKEDRRKTKEDDEDVFERQEEREVDGWGKDNLAILIWLFSPFTATISTRGSGESLVVCMLIGMLLLLKKRKIVWAAVLYGVAVHWRIFPIIFAPSILLYLGRATRAGTACGATSGATGGATGGATSGKQRSGNGVGVVRAYVSAKGVLFGLVSAGVFFGLGAAMHGLYGNEFLEETYLYHLTRVDPRHNFSFYFYPAYLHMQEGSSQGDRLSSVFSLAGLAVQAALADRMMRRHESKDLAMAFLTQSIAFVAFNKVSTAQYFVWYLCWFCLRLEKATARIDRRWVLAWPAALAWWLFWAYLLEFRGLQVHLLVWIAGLVWFAVNVGLLRGLVQGHG